MLGCVLVAFGFDGFSFWLAVGPACLVLFVRIALSASFEIHWLSNINSFVFVMLLTAFLTIIIMRMLKNDFSRYLESDEESMEEEEVSL